MNAIVLRSVLDGMRGSFRDVADLNAAGAFIMVGRATTLKEGAAIAQESLDGGAAAARLNQLVAISNAR